MIIRQHLEMYKTEIRIIKAIFLNSLFGSRLFTSAQKLEMFHTSKMTANTKKKCFPLKDRCE